MENMKKRKCDHQFSADAEAIQESLVQKFISLYNAMSEMKDILISYSQHGRFLYCQVELECFELRDTFIVKGRNKSKCSFILLDYLHKLFSK